MTYRDLCITPWKRPHALFGVPHLDEVNGPRQWVNPVLFEALRPSLQDLVSKSVDGSKSACNEVRRGYAKVFYNNYMVNSNYIHWT
jgi:hypothetical protein